MQVFSFYYKENILAFYVSYLTFLQIHDLFFLVSRQLIFLSMNIAILLFYLFFSLKTFLRLKYPYLCFLSHSVELQNVPAHELFFFLWYFQVNLIELQVFLFIFKFDKMVIINYLIVNFLLWLISFLNLIFLE